MSTTLSSPAPTRRPNTRRARVVVATAGLLASAGIALSVTQANAPGERASSEPVYSATSGPVTGDEAAPLSLADPWILHHHGVNTASAGRSAQEIAAERFHHR